MTPPRWLLPLLYAVAIWVVSSGPIPEQVIEHVPIWDKAAHVIEYAVLAVLLCWALRGRALWWLIAVSLTALYGAVDEFHQSFVPGRSSDVLDALADLVGAVLGTTLYHVAAPPLSRWGAAGRPGQPAGRP